MGRQAATLTEALRDETGSLEALLDKLSITAVCWR